MMRLSVPSKTFVLGEYAVLSGHRALIVNTEPRFELTTAPGVWDSRPEGSQKRSTSSYSQIHKASPAGLLLKELDQSGGDLFFSDPYGGLGGMGASSAQFLLLYAFVNRIGEDTVLGRFPKGTGSRETLTEIESKSFSVDQLNLMRKRYIENCRMSAPSGIAASGADLVAQALGGWVWGDRFEGSAWPFANASFFILRTGEKLATHSHLQSLESETHELAFRALGTISESGYSAFQKGDLLRFAEAISATAHCLQKEGLCCEHTLKILEEAKKVKGCLAVKGCGALGADTIFALVGIDGVEDFRAWALERKLEVLATERQVSRGFTRENNVAAAELCGLGQIVT